VSDPNQIESLRQLCARLFPLEEDLENASLRLRRWARKTRADGFVRYGKNLRNQDFLRALALDQQLNAADGSVVGPLELLNAALLSAVERGDVSEMTTLALSHARWSERTAGESPLDALRAGSLNRARALVARNPADRRALWRLLLAWELNATGQLSDAETVLRDGAKDTDRPEVSALLSDQAVALLPRILEVDPEGFHFLQRTLLGDNQRLSLCQALGREGQPHHAMRVAAKLPDHGSRVFATRAFMGPLISFPGLVDAVVTTALRCPARPDGAGGCVAGPDAADPIGSVPSAQPADADDLTGVDLTAVDLTGIEAPPEPGYLEHCLAVAYAHCQEFAMARAAIDELLRAPDRARRALGHHALECVAVAHAAAGDLDLAAETLAEISHTYMHHGRVVGTVAFIGALAGRAEDAARLAERALAPEPSAPSGRSTDPRPLDLVLAKIVFGAARGGAVDVAMVFGYAPEPSARSPSDSLPRCPASRSP
jgi:tetratricopeptide (TPR) repeat protein